MIQMIYSANGKPINLPKSGKKKLQTGTWILKKHQWIQLEKDHILNRNKDWDNLTQSHITEEELIEV